MQSLTNIKDLLEQSIPRSPPDTRPLVCCCGGSDCAFLQRAHTTLDGLESDVHTAAKLGQVGMTISYSAIISLFDVV